MILKTRKQGGAFLDNDNNSAGFLAGFTKIKSYARNHYGMKNCILWFLLLCAGFPLFAQNTSRYSFYIPLVSGIGKNTEDNEFFYLALAREISSGNHVLTADQKTADFILSSKLIRIPGQKPSEQLNLFHIILIDNKTNNVVAEQELIYDSLEEAAVLLAVIVGDIFSAIDDKGNPNAWQNKWFYLRLSLDYSLDFFGLKGTGLLEGLSVTGPDGRFQLDNKTIAVPGLTLGLEIVQFLSWLSFEVNFQAGIGDPVDFTAINAAVGAEIKFPLKMVKNFTLEPYGAFLYPLTVSPAYSKTPGPAIGAGFQAGVKGGKNGVFFIDIRFMYYLQDALLKNAYKDFTTTPPDPPNPTEIHYRHFALGFGFGYKYGFFDRK
ncbi:MAG: hypothetical protein LBH43_03890 [Treponema sp.]|jgi:hypothetical protein|nr:hypothetical protein [Treponema sp.]